MTRLGAIVRPLPFIVLASLLLPNPARAGWPADPRANVPVATSGEYQQAPQVVSDGSGGAIVVWQDVTLGEEGIYARRLSSDGEARPQSSPLGVLIRGRRGAQWQYSVSDGSGGAIELWQEQNRDGWGNLNVYAAHLNGLTTDTRWRVDGVPIDTSSGADLGVISGSWPLTAAPDGAGGAFVAYHESRGPGSYELKVFVHHLRSNGTVDPAWPVNGLPACAASGDQMDPSIVPDGQGGLLVAWSDFRDGFSDVYMQHVLAAGTVDPAWPASGLPVCAAVQNQFSASLVTDRAGGAIITWEDLRGGNWALRSQRVTPAGKLLWQANGILLTSALTPRESGTPVTVAVGDDAGGAIVCWQEGSDRAVSNLIAQHILPGGQLDPAWAQSGAPVSLAPGAQASPVAIADGHGGILVAWVDTRNGKHIYAGHLEAGGVVDPAWPVSGAVVCSARGDQVMPQIDSDGAGGVILAWMDFRGGDGIDANSGVSHIYAQRVTARGQLGDVIPQSLFSLGHASPNPASGATRIRFSLPAYMRMVATIHDSSGRLVRRLFDGSAGPGAEDLEWDGRDDRGFQVPSGVYFCTLEAGGERLTGKLIRAR